MQEIFTAEIGLNDRAAAMLATSDPEIRERFEGLITIERKAGLAHRIAGETLRETARGIGDARAMLAETQAQARSYGVEPDPARIEADEREITRALAAHERAKTELADAAAASAAAREATEAVTVFLNSIAKEV